MFVWAICPAQGGKETRDTGKLLGGAHCVNVVLSVFLEGFFFYVMKKSGLLEKQQSKCKCQTASD